MKKSRRTRRGGEALVGRPYAQSDTSTWGNSNYYPYNETPRLFTDYIYNDQQFMFKGGRKRRKRRTRRGGTNSLHVWAQPLTNYYRATTYMGDSQMNNFYGRELGVNPSILKQPISP
jgi:hypothetical protein